MKSSETAPLSNNLGVYHSTNLKPNSILSINSSSNEKVVKYVNDGINIQSNETQEVSNENADMSDPIYAKVNYYRKSIGEVNRILELKDGPQNKMTLSTSDSKKWTTSKIFQKCDECSHSSSSYSSKKLCYSCSATSMAENSVIGILCVPKLLIDIRIDVMCIPFGIAL